MQTKRENHWTIQQHVRVPYFCWSNRKITRMGHTALKNFSMVLRHGRTCSKMRGTTFRIGKQEDGATILSFSSLFGRSEEWESKGELSEVCSHIVLKCLYLARDGRPDILWSVNKLTRSNRKWTQACDRRLARLTSHIHYTSNYRQYCHVGNAAQHCRRQRSCDKDDHQSQKPDDETRVPHPPSCSGLVL